MDSKLKTARYDPGVAVLNNKIYACGGFNKERQELSSVEVYDPTQDRYFNNTLFLRLLIVIRLGKHQTLFQLGVCSEYEDT